MLRKVVPVNADRWKYAWSVVNGWNDDGLWWHVGEVTTILLWVGTNITVGHQISHVCLPAAVNLLVPLTIANFWLFQKGSVLRTAGVEDLTDDSINRIPLTARKLIFWIGILSLALVPVFRVLTNLSPFLCGLLGLVSLWRYIGVVVVR